MLRTARNLYTSLASLFLKKPALFDRDYYLERYPDVASLGVDPLWHFMNYGMKENRVPHPFIDVSYYVEMNHDVALSGQSPVSHILKQGIEEGRSPNPCVDPAFIYEYYSTSITQNESEDRFGAALRYFIGRDGTSGRLTSELVKSSEKISASRQIVAASDFSDAPRIAVMLHMFYPEMWPDILVYLKNIPGEFDLLLTFPDYLFHKVLIDVPSEVNNVRLFPMENRGRDILPLLRLQQKGILKDYDIICKIHTKKSHWNVDGMSWRHDIFKRLLGSRSTVLSIVEEFRKNDQLGLIGPSSMLLSSSSPHFWTKNVRILTDIIEKLGSRCALDGLEFYAGSMYWFRPDALQKLQQLNITSDDFPAEAGQEDGTMAHAIERAVLLAVTAAEYSYTDESAVTARNICSMDAAQSGHHRQVELVAFYLPQFHPIQENDMWWGKGFTEWYNVVRARPLFKGHIQPRLPYGLGFYDLRLPEIRQQQAAMARQYGIGAFCYYYYWFDGKRLLDTPINDMLESGEPDFPFCICWANENWTRAWDGLDRDILMEQRYEDGFHIRFIDDVIRFMRDPRYLRFKGKPVLLIYNIQRIPNLCSVVDDWRGRCREASLGDIHLCAVRTFNFNKSPMEYGFDAAVEFPPHNIRLPLINNRLIGKDHCLQSLKVYDYWKCAQSCLGQFCEGYPEGAVHRGLMVSWDNTPRRCADGYVFHGSNPKMFGMWLSSILMQEDQHNADNESMVFINAWNEWAECAMLEPDDKFGLGYLETVRSALEEYRGRNPFVSMFD